MYLLDSSAWLAHILRESGGQVVNEWLSDDATTVYISVLSLVEVQSRLKVLGLRNLWPFIFQIYRTKLLVPLPVTEQIAQRAIEIREDTPKRIPSVDSLIAATAAVYGLTLVHRDPHLANIPDALVAQIQLPTK